MSILTIRFDIRGQKWHFPKSIPYCYSEYIGVLPRAQGKGFASKLMIPILKRNKALKVPTFLETANGKLTDLYTFCN